MIAIGLVACSARPDPFADAEGSSGALDGGSAGSDGTAGSEPAEFYGSGFRLRAVVQRSDAGDVVFSHWYDRALDLECAMRPVASGRLRCLPVREAAVEFAGASCSEVAVPVSCWRTGDHLTTVVEGCGATTEYTAWQVGDEARVSSNSDGECRSFHDGFLLEPLDLETFVGGMTATESLGGVEREVVLGADGSWAWGGLLDPEREMPCRAKELAAGTVCAPAALARVGEFHGDASCCGETLAAALVDDGCVPPAFAESRDGTELLSLRDAVNDPFGLDQGGQCASLNHSSARYWTVAPLDGDSFVAVDVESSPGPRLRRRVVSMPDGGPLALHHEPWLDSRTQLPCVAQPTLSGALVCAPQNSIYESMFADADCRVPLDYRSPSFADEGEWLTVARNACPQPPVRFVGQRGPAHRGDVYVLDGTCRILEGATGMHTFSTLLEMDELPALTIVTE
ncbi:MAG: hypothetical protein AAF721_13530 [Myxococcota bacterium]